MKLYQVTGHDIFDGTQHTGVYLADDKKKAAALSDHDAVLSGWVDDEIWWVIDEIEELMIVC